VISDFTNKAKKNRLLSKLTLCLKKNFEVDLLDVFKQGHVQKNMDNRDKRSGRFVHKKSPVITDQAFLIQLNFISF